MSNNNISIEDKLADIKDIVSELENSQPSSEESKALLSRASSCIEELLRELQDV